MSDEVIGEEPQEDPFAEATTVKGLEGLGRAIVDKNGIPSGSPANYEATRGRRPDDLLPALDEVVSSIAAEFGIEK